MWHSVARNHSLRLWWWTKGAPPWSPKGGGNPRPKVPQIALALIPLRTPKQRMQKLCYEENWWTNVTYNTLKKKPHPWSTYTKKDSKYNTQSDTMTIFPVKWSFAAKVARRLHFPPISGRLQLLFFFHFLYLPSVRLPSVGGCRCRLPKLLLKSRGHRGSQAPRLRCSRCDFVAFNHGNL